MPGDQPLDTAHQAWDGYWQDPMAREIWETPERAVLDLVGPLRARGSTRVLDLGAGVGRNALALAAAGFDVIATDASEAGLNQIQEKAAATGLRVATARCPFSQIAVADDSVDHVLAWNVLYHGDGDLFAAALRECRRVLHDGGTLQFTMLSKRHRRFGLGEQVRPDTFVDHAGEGDKAHPHFFVDAAGLSAALAEAHFEVLSLVDVDQCPPGKQPNQWHWTALAEAVTPLGNTSA